MLDPRYLESVPDALLALYAQAEADILTDMARRISVYDYWIPAAEWQRKKLLEMGETHDEIMKRLSGLTGKSQSELTRLFLEAGNAAVEADNAIYTAHGLETTSIKANEALQKVLAAGLKRTNGLFANLTRTTANTAAGQFERALDRAYMQVTSGAFDANTAVRMAVKDLARQGVGAVQYPGRVETIEAAVRRAVVTGVNQTALELQMQLAGEMGCDLVEVTAHAGARPEHAVWQGKIYSRSGKHPRYPDFVSATGYGTGAGLGGWNCRHSFSPYFEGSPRAYTPEMLASYEAQNYTYNGRKMTEYEATQTQRYIERQIRRWKREESAMRAAGQDAGEAAAKTAKWQDAQRDFIRQTGLKRQYDREQIGGAAGIARTAKSGIIKPTAQAVKTGRESALAGIQHQSWQELLQPKDREALASVFQSTTEENLHFWEKYGELVKGDFYDRKANGYYSPKEKRVHLQIDKIDARSERIGQTSDVRLFFHETGHLFDDNILSGAQTVVDKLPELRQRLTLDFVAYANTVYEKSGTRRIKSLARLSDEQKRALTMDLLQDPHIKNAVSDLAEGLTAGRVFGRYGHGKQYWEWPGRLEQEAVAHMFEARMMQGERKEIFERYFPTAYQYFEEFLKSLEV